MLKDEQRQVLGGVETFRDLTLVEALRKEVEKSFSFEDIISSNENMREIFNILPDVAVSDSTILIEGESGTGKELMAKAIHNLSRRRAKPLVIVNCGAIPDTLLESELFGYKAGAFTGANRDKPGRFAQADGGTMFLDEIGDVSPALQVRLLRRASGQNFSTSWRYSNVALRRQDSGCNKQRRQGDGSGWQVSGRFVLQDSGLQALGTSFERKEGGYSAPGPAFRGSSQPA